MWKKILGNTIIVNPFNSPDLIGNSPFYLLYIFLYYKFKELGVTSWKHSLERCD